MVTIIFQSILAFYQLANTCLMKSDSKSFSLQLNLNDWSALSKRATEKGYDGTRQMIYGEMEKLSKNRFFARRCKGLRKKQKNNYPIPENLRDFFANMACKHSCSISEIVYRYIVLPELILHRLNNCEEDN